MNQQIRIQLVEARSEARRKERQINILKMPKSKRSKIEFETRKRIFDLVGDEGACTFCKMFPRMGPIYQSQEEGAIVCSSCKDSKRGEFQQNDVTKLLEKMLATLPRS